jgi:hypothetical protein
MNRVMLYILMSLAVVASAPGLAVNAAAAVRQAPKQPAATLASVIDGEISAIEKEIVEAAEAMPAARFDFSPERLRIPDSDYAGVRTFAQQLKHVAASNYALWSSLTGANVADQFNGGRGPEAIATKAEIVTFLKDSFAFGHKAVATLTAENMLRPAAGNDSRLHRAVFAVSHAYDHYGQIVEYLRMNGIIPPASR